MDRIINAGFGIALTVIITLLLYVLLVAHPKQVENHKKELEAAYNSGRFAAQKGLPETINPYPPTQFYQSERLNWSMGYLSEKMK